MADTNPTTPVVAEGSDAPVEKSKNADKNEAKRLAKMEKFLAKQKVPRSDSCENNLLFFFPTSACSFILDPTPVY